ncbi:hypothetical protein AiwAL_12740 [Acidiphilium sp. AL]|uniref:Uncharacterized protein n=1 Tax=Acidiphilium iwatense TaxID=768198 RepID=A0ABS9DYX6_9PROT|nr:MULTISPECIES: hypothetical protein [Acidiphilium]MCF3947957.1 hypothetical protein [Acidiphilium iwatense]MCU4160962.1 hypothetical protein [Acidiphilium sp. AL]
MTHATDVVVSVILALAGLVMDFVAYIDGLLAALMTSGGIPPNVQTILLVVVAVSLVILAIRVLGRLFAALIIVLLLVHKLFPGMEVPQGHPPAWLHLPGWPHT